MDNINVIVSNLTKTYDTNDPYEIANELGILTIICPLGKIKGHFLFKNNIKVFFINDTLSQKDKTIVCTILLGHSILYPNLNIILFNLDFNEQLRQFFIELFGNEFL